MSGSDPESPLPVDQPGADGPVAGCGCDRALRHRDEIRAAYWSGSSLDDLAGQWCASLKLIMLLVYGDEVADPSGSSQR